MGSYADKFALLGCQLAPILWACSTILSCGGSVAVGTDVSAGGTSGSIDAAAAPDGNGAGDTETGSDGADAFVADGDKVDAHGTDAGPDAEAYDPLCDPILPEAEALSLWSRGDTVSLMVGAADQRKLFLRTANGWQTTFVGAEGSTTLGIRGRPDGSVFEFGLTPCGVRLIQNGVSICSAAAWEIAAVSAPADDLAYAVDQHRLYAYDGVEWTEAGELSPADHIKDVWADGTRVLVASSHLWWWKDGSFAEVLGATPASYSKTWVSGGRIVAGTKEGKLIVNEDGGSTEVWTSPCHERVLGVWGEDEHVFFLTRREFGLWRPSEVTVFSSYECDAVNEYRSLWGSTTSKVFIVGVRDGCISSCGCVRVEAWNGSALVPL